MYFYNIQYLENMYRGNLDLQSDMCGAALITNKMFILINIIIIIISTVSKKKNKFVH